MTSCLLRIIVISIIQLLILSATFYNSQCLSPFFYIQYVIDLYIFQLLKLSNIINTQELYFEFRNIYILHFIF